ncbi:long-chain fatty acid transport protein 1-like [Macrosteles quadrilineatus]|uniref:long-chain fatty acid transport protein 1-like n=1 Tax=Macrosteles quadrilineatus TaxID=74068 RepID=UPI0023E0FE23|nr:long-chain fatty acid transport protein 1-like [Macrosteles quadrilineatus]
MESYVVIILLGLFFSVFQWQASLCVCVASLAVFYWRKIYIVLKTLPRDLRLLYRVHLMVRRTVSCKKRNISVVDAFYKQLRTKPSKPCYYFEDQIWTYEDVEDYSNEVANVFNEAGFAKGDVVAVMMHNCPEYVCTWLGLAKLGVISALINTNLKLGVLAHCINNSNAKAIIFSNKFTSVITEAKDLLEEEVKFYQVGDTVPVENILDLSKMMTLSSRKPPNTTYKPGYDDQLLYIFTSGTTGKPKAARFPNSRFILISNAARTLVGVKEDDVIYDPLPLYHVAGGALGVGPALIYGAPAVLRAKFSASGYFEDCIKYKCTVGQYIGEMCRYLLASKVRPEDRQHKVRLMMGNGMQASIWKRFVERFGVQNIVELYGATEGNVNLGNLNGKIGAIGAIPQCLPKFMIPMAIIRVDEESSQPIRDKNGLCIWCKPGETGMFVGTIRQNDPTRQYHGYVNQDESKRKVIYDVLKKGDQAFLSGDLVMMDEEGYIYFKDRTGDTFRWKGENVSTSEVESVVSSIVGLKECTVYGVQVGDLEGRAGMMAVEEGDEPLDLPGLAEGLDRALPTYARPVFLRLAQVLPHTGTFKLKKIDLQKEGFNPSTISDKLYLRQYLSFTRLTPELYEDVITGKIKI